jgi:hypothetical protein
LILIEDLKVLQSKRQTFHDLFLFDFLHLSAWLGAGAVWPGMPSAIFLIKKLLKKLVFVFPKNILI